jgi:hypothetical protein
MGFLALGVLSVAYSAYVVFKDNDDEARWEKKQEE